MLDDTHHSAIQDQQKTCPHAVAVGCRRGSRHSMHVAFAPSPACTRARAYVRARSAAGTTHTHTHTLDDLKCTKMRERAYASFYLPLSSAAGRAFAEPSTVPGALQPLGDAANEPSAA